MIASRGAPPPTILPLAALFLIARQRLRHDLDHGARTDAGRLPGHRDRAHEARDRASTTVVSGDAGCDDPTLIPTAIGFDAHGLDQAEPVRIHLYIFRNRDSFERLRATIDACARSFVTDPETYETVEQSPFVLAGQGPWAPEFEAAIRDGPGGRRRHRRLIRERSRQARRAAR